MIDADPSLREATPLSTSALALYLQSTGWTVRPSHVTDAQIFVKVLPGADEPVYILLAESGTDDERRRIADALRTIEAVEERPLTTIAEEISQIPIDTNLAVHFNSGAVPQRAPVTTYSRRPTIEAYLTLLSRLSTNIGVTVLVALFVLKVQISTAADGGVVRLENWMSYFKTSPFSLPIMLIELALYVLASNSVKSELSIGTKLFLPDRAPTVWDNQNEPQVILLSSILFLLLCCFVMWFSDNIMILSFIMTVVSCMDLRTRYLIKKSAHRYLSSESYSVVPNDEDYELITERRRIFAEFLEKPHFLKEGARILGFGLAFAISALGYLYKEVALDTTAYSILITIVIFNEGLTHSWRSKLANDMSTTDKNPGGATSSFAGR